MVVEENGLAVKCKRGSGEEYVVENIYIWRNKTRQYIIIIHVHSLRQVHKGTPPFHKKIHVCTHMTCGIWNMERSKMTL